MSDGPIPRLSPYEVLQVLDQMLLEAEEARRMTAWKHHAVCGGYTEGIWEPDAACSRCHFEVSDREHIEQYLLVPVKEPAAVTEPRCYVCLGRGVVPDYNLWDDYHGEPKPKSCPRCGGSGPPG